MKTLSSSRIIGAEALSGVRPFALSELVRRGASSGRARISPGTAPGTAAGFASAPEDFKGDPVFEAGLLQGRREGYALGTEAAREQAKKDLARQQAQGGEHVAGRVAALSDALAAQYAELEGSLASEVVDLAIELARQMVRQSLRADRDAILAVVGEAIAALIDERASFALHLNPADAELVASALGPTLDARGGRIVIDRAVAAGGCRVITSGAEVDATVGTRWRRVLASVGHTAPNDDPLCDD